MATYIHGKIDYNSKDTTKKRVPKSNYDKHVKINLFAKF